MSVNLTPEIEQLIRQKMETGHYDSASQLIGEALRLLDDKELSQKRRNEEIRREIEVGLKELDEGKGIPFTHELVEEIKSQGRARLEAEKREIRR